LYVDVSLQGISTFKLGRRGKECTSRRTAKGEIRDGERKGEELDDLIKLSC